MKKMLLALAVVGLFVGLSYAGTPQDRDSQNGAYSSASIFGSTSTTSANVTYTLAAPTAINSGGGSYSGRYCFNTIVFQGVSGSTISIVDNSTTATNTNAISYLGAGVNSPIIFQAAHNEPLCFGFGHSVSFVLGANSGAGLVTYQGYTTYGSAGGSYLNAGQ